MDTGKYRNDLIKSETVSMTAAVTPGSEIAVPNYGDVAGFIINITQSTTGTLTGAKTLDYAINEVVVKTKKGETLTQSVRGIDLLFIERNRMKGKSRTIATTSSSSQSETFFIPLNIEKADLDAKIRLSIAAYSAMATSGATAGSLYYELYAVYYDNTEKLGTEQIRRITRSLNSGSNTLGADLPKDVTITNIMFKVGTESNITSIDFTGDGNKELDAVTPAFLKAHENALYVSGHVSNEFSLFNSPFYSSSKSRLDITMSSSDTMELFTIVQFPSAK